jgi:hypothetical protein
MTEITRAGSNSAEVSATEDQAVAQPEMGCDFLMMSWISLLMGFLVTTVTLAAYHFWLAKPTAGFAVVDLASVVKIKKPNSPLCSPVRMSATRTGRLLT